MLSGSDPEYPTYKMLESYASFLKEGGYFMHLAGTAG